MGEDADDDFVVFGTRLNDEEESRGNQRHKHVTDPTATRALPLHKQVSIIALIIATRATNSWY